ncbi:MAG: class I SAM-dependent methyltransferase [Methanothrix sp.]|nr:class I SAM-dependent methyltransferase [Methanothrix sp.]
MSHAKAWDKDYRSRGRLWGGGVKDLPELPAGCSVLEMGCGSGKTLAGLAGRARRVIGLDISVQALRLCRPCGPKIDLILGDACRLPFPSESFDAVFAFHVTGHLLLAGRHALAREAARVLKLGGRLLFREFGAEDMRAKKGQEVERGTFRRKEGIITHYFTEAEAMVLFGDLEPICVCTHRWRLRVKGRDLMRSEVKAVFLKT